MIIEYIRYGLIDAAQAQQFEHDYALAASWLDESEHCLSYQLTRCVDQPLQYVLQICWDSAQGHLQGFRASSDFPKFLARVSPYLPQLLEMRHYEPTSVAGGKSGGS